MSESVHLEPFELGEQIGKGGMASVYRGRHRETGVEVALKVLARSVGEETREQFEREVRAQAGLVHPAIVYLFEYGEVSERAAARSDLTAGSPFVAMELADGGTVRERIPLEGWSALRSTLARVLDALAFGHARRVIHRDLKPANFLLFRSGEGEDELKLADFGAAYAVGEESDRSRESLSSAAGTPAYMAPEQVRGAWRRYGPWTDLYALGCIAWELACGHPPFEKSSARATMEMHEIEPRPSLEPQFPVPERLEAWIHRAMAIDPGDRFQRAAEAARALDSLEELDAREDSGSASRIDATRPTLQAVTTVEQPVETDAGLASSVDSSFADGDSGPEAEAWESEWAERLVPEQWRPPDTDQRPSLLVGTGLGLFALRETPFVDRDAERDRIWEMLRDVDRSGEPRVALVVGHSGAGKSRLVDWVATRAHELGAVNLLRAVHTEGGAGPSEGVAGMIRRAVRGQKLTRGQFHAHLRSRLPPLGEGDDRERDARALCELVYPTDESDSTVDGPRYQFANRHQKAALVARWIRRYGRRRRAIVWLDDAQWGDLALELAQHLLESREEAPAALVAVTVRSDVLAESEQLLDRVRRLADHERSRRIDLKPLGAEDHRRFVDRLLPLEASLGDRLAARTEGNPLFATQLVGHLVADGRLEEGPRGFRLREEASLDLPEDIHELWSRRLEQLVGDLEAETPGAVWQSLEMAAALGREVDGEEWVCVCEAMGVEGGAAVRDALIGRGLAEQTEHGWAIAHGLLVESLERHARRAGRWQAHHRHCARLLEWREAAGRSPSALRRADHWERAGQPERALEPLLREAERLETVGALGRARRVLERREKNLDRLDAPEPDARRVENDIKIAAYDLDRGTTPGEVLEAIGGAIDRAEQCDEARLVAKAWSIAARASSRQGDHDRAERAARRAIEAARGGEDAAELAGVLISAGWADYAGGEFDRADRRFSEARHHAHQAEHRWYELLARRSTVWVSLARADYDRAAEETKRLWRRSRETGYRWLEADCLNAFGEIARFRGEVELARECYEEYRRLSEELNAPDDVAIAEQNLAQVELMARRFERAAKHLDEAERRFEELSRTTQVLQSLRATRVVLVAGRGDWERFDELFEAYAERWPGERRHVTTQPWLLEMAGDYAAEAGEARRARRVWRWARRFWQKLEAEQAVARVDDKIAGHSS